MRSLAAAAAGETPRRPVSAPRGRGDSGCLLAGVGPTRRAPPARPIALGMAAIYPAPRRRQDRPPEAPQESAPAGRDGQGPARRGPPSGPLALGIAAIYQWPRQDRPPRRPRRALLLAVAILAACWPAPAQRGEGRRRVSSPIAFYNDADPATPGMLNVSTYFSYHRVPAGRDYAWPGASFNAGLHRRVDVSMSMGVVRSEFEDSRIDAFGDTLIAAKVLLFGEGRRRPALALNPMIEILGRPSIQDNPLAPDRVNYVLPLAVQKSFDEFRVYYMAGYLTRGIAFNSAAWEINKWSRVTPVVIVSHSRLTHELGLISELGLNRSRSDVTGGVGVTLAPNWSLFVNTGRTFGRMDLNSTRYQVTAGVSFNVRLWGRSQEAGVRSQESEGRRQNP